MYVPGVINQCGIGRRLNTDADGVAASVAAPIASVHSTVAVQETAPSIVSAPDAQRKGQLTKYVRALNEYEGEGGETTQLPLPPGVAGSCNYAAVGELCRASGECGTNGQLNNCYGRASLYQRVDCWHSGASPLPTEAVLTLIAEGTLTDYDTTWQGLFIQRIAYMLNITSRAIRVVVLPSSVRIVITIDATIANKPVSQIQSAMDSVIGTTIAAASNSLGLTLVRPPLASLNVPGLPSSGGSDTVLIIVLVIGATVIVGLLVLVAWFRPKLHLKTVLTRHRPAVELEGHNAERIAADVALAYPVTEKVTETETATVHGFPVQNVSNVSNVSI